MKRVCQKTDECEHYLRLQEFIENTKAPITGDIPFDCCKEYNYKLEQELEQYKKRAPTYHYLLNELERHREIVKNNVSEKMYFYIKKQFEEGKPKFEVYKIDLNGD